MSRSHNNTKNQAKRLLKEKLVNYQNELKQESNIVIYDGYMTSASQKFGLGTLDKNFLVDDGSFVGVKSRRYNSGDYEQYLNGDVEGMDWGVKRRSLTRENILAINKKGKVIKSSLNQMAKQRNQLLNGFTPYASLENSTSLNLHNMEDTLSPRHGEKKPGGLRSLLTIKQSKQQEIERPYDYMRRTVSQQTTRVKPRSAAYTRVSTSKNRAQASAQFYTITNPQITQTTLPSHEQQLTEYFTPCHHKETGTGYIVNDFQPRMRAKHFGDNLKVMAKMIKKKISNLERDQIVQYLRKISEQKCPSATSDGKIQEMVRRNNWFSERSLLENKLGKNKKNQQEPKTLLRMLGVNKR